MARTHTHNTHTGTQTHERTHTSSHHRGYGLNALMSPNSCGTIHRILVEHSQASLDLMQVRFVHIHLAGLHDIDHGPRGPRGHTPSWMRSVSPLQMWQLLDGLLARKGPTVSLGQGKSSRKAGQRSEHQPWNLCSFDLKSLCAVEAADQGLDNHAQPAVLAKLLSTSSSHSRESTE